MYRTVVVVAALLPMTSAAAPSGSPATVDASQPTRVSYNDHIRPILANHCVACHGGVKQASGVSFIYREKALAEGDSGMRAIVPGDLESSYLVERVSDPDPDYRMPPVEHGPPLDPQEIGLLKQWIAEGADWEQHWSFRPPHARHHRRPRKPVGQRRPSIRLFWPGLMLRASRPLRPLARASGCGGQRST